MKFQYINLLSLLLMACSNFVGITKYYGQDYSLLPESCTYCFYKYTLGASTFYNAYYEIDVDADTIIGGDSYLNIDDYSFSSGGRLSIRQVGNKLYGVPKDSINDLLIMDFDVIVGDTLTGLYSSGYSYVAVVTDFDSVMVNYGVYHRFILLQGISYTHPIYGITNSSWNIKWNERGLCADPYGGIIYNIPVNGLTISGQFYDPHYCTTDTLYNDIGGYTCANCQPVYSNVNKHLKSLIKIYPNPGTTFLNLEFTNFDFKKITIRSSIGQLIDHKRVQSNFYKLDISNLPVGIYYLTVNEKETVYTKPFIVE